ncbi:MAG: MarR family winged helix-turn-helix transcriptional regulator [Kiritimatiellia bacterium]
MPTRHQGSEEEIAALNATICLMRAANTLQAHMASLRTQDGMTMSQFAVLEALFHLGPLCQNELAEKLLVSGPNITRVIDLLERDGLVERVRSRQDRRYIMITLTERGHTKIGEVFPRHVEELLEAFSAMSPSEQEDLRELCKKLGTSILERKLPS